MKKETRMIFNLKQANFIMKKEGVVTIGCGLGSKDNKAYICFEYNEAFQKAFEEWRDRK